MQGPKEPLSKRLRQEEDQDEPYERSKRMSAYFYQC